MKKATGAASRPASPASDAPASVRTDAGPAVVIEHVSKTFDGQAVLRDVSLTVPKNCVYGLIGPGAAGKSVLLKMIPGLVRPDKGRIFVHSEDIHQMTELELSRFRLKFGMLFQNNALFDHMTVADNISFPLRRMYEMSEEEIEKRIAERLKVVSLPGFEHRLPPGLSGGQKKRIGFARASVCDADLLLYDEPAAGLDPVTSQKIFNLVRDEQRTAKSTVVTVSSDLDRLLTVTDRVGMLYRGKLIFDGTTEEAKACRDPYVRQFVHGLTDGPL